MPADAPPPRRSLLLAPSGGPIVSRLVSALTLRPDFYVAAAADESGTGPAGAIVCLIALVRDAPYLYQLSQTEPAWAFGMLIAVTLAVLRWLAVGLAAWLLQRVIGPRSSYRRLLRVLAYADAPTMLLALDPWLPPSPHLYYLPDIALNLWAFAATLIALRATAAMSLRRALLLAVPVYVVQRLTFIVISQ